MTIVGRDVLEAAGKTHRGRKLDKALAAWMKIAETHLASLLRCAAILAERRLCEGTCGIDIRGNQFWLVVKINFKIGVLAVEKVMTHPEYD